MHTAVAPASNKAACHAEQASHKLVLHYAAEMKWVMQAGTVRQGLRTSDGKDLLSACGEGQGNGQGAEHDEAGFQRVPPAAEGGILPSQQHIQRVSA